MSNNENKRNKSIYDNLFSNIPYDTKEVYDYPNGFLILFNTVNEEDYLKKCNNVFFFSLDGTIKWQIEDYHIYSNGRPSLSYYNLEVKEEKDTFIAWTLTGKRIVVDIQTGKINDELPHMR